MKTNDSEAVGFAEMAATAPQTEFDRLANIVGGLSADMDELKRRHSLGEAPIAQTLLAHSQRLDAIERYLNQQMQNDTVQRDTLERNTRHSALDLAIKACPPGTEFDNLNKVYKGILNILRGEA